MSTCEEKLIVGVDGDNTLFNTCRQLRDYVKKQTNGLYSKYHFEPSSPEEKFPEEFRLLREDFMKSKNHIAELPLFPGVNIGLRILERHFSDVLLITARREFQKVPLRQLLEDKQLLASFSGMMLRPEEKNPKESKFENAMNAGITDMVDDDPLVSLRLAAEGIRVAMLDRSWNQWVPSNKNIIRVGEFIDYAVLIAKFRTPENLFDYHNKYRLKGRDSLQLPWVITSNDWKHTGYINRMRSRQAEVAREKLDVDMIKEQVLTRSGNGEQSGYLEKLAFRNN